MSHHVYNTKAFVLGFLPQKENDRIVIFFTEELGLIYGIAQGVRKETSKLRGILLEGAFVNVSLIRGRNIWRVTTASLGKDVLSSLKNDKELQKSYLRILSLLERLVKGEEKHIELFATLNDVLAFLSDGDISEQNGFEIVLVSRILFHLGYLAPKDVPEGIVSDPLSIDLLKFSQIHKKQIVSVINSGLRASGLE